MIVIDGNSLVYRAFHAIPLLTTNRGLVTNAAYGFTNMLLKILEQEQPGLVIVTFDKSRLTFRNQQYSEYKANRKPMPAELRPQFQIIKDILQAMRITVLELEGYEADDLIGTIVAQAGKANISTLIISGDRDVFQLISANTKVLITRKGITQLDIYDDHKVRERFGISPHQFIDFRALTGDSSDNIPGVPGIGEKTAAKLLQQYPSLDDILDNLDQLPKRQQEKIKQHREQALLSKQLVTIKQDVPIEVNLNKCTYNNPDHHRLLKLFTELEFKSLAKSLLADNSSKEISDLAPADAVSVVYQKITTPEQLQELINTTRSAGKIALVLGGSKETGVITAVIATGDQYPVFCLPVEGQSPEYLQTLKTICEDPKITKVCHHAKNIIWLLDYHDIKLKNLSFDVGIAAYLLNPTVANTNLENLALAYLDQVLLPDAASSLPSQANAIYQLAPLFHKKLQEQQQEQLFYTMELPLVNVLAEMEIQGMAVDRQILEDMSVQLGQHIAILIQEIHNLSGEKFNINSPKQLGKILFEKLGLPVVKKTKTGYSTDASVLESLSASLKGTGKQQIIIKLLQYRQLAKLKSTYADGLISLISKKTGHIHTTLNQTATATGRLSSTAPNLQNIPIRLELGKQIRRAFIPSNSDNLILTADYSQIELRVLAHISGDPGFLEAFNNKQDIHVRTASEVFNVPVDAVTLEMRSRAKAVNFGIIYGISDFGLSRDIKVSRAEARRYINNYFARCPGVKKYIDQIIVKAKECGYVTTLFNRRRYLPELASSSHATRNFGERIAMNTPIQGSAADIIKLAMINIHKQLQKNKLFSKMILQVHDELIFDAPKNEMPALIKLVKGCMENALSLDVPLVVDIKTGPNWYEVKPVNS